MTTIQFKIPQIDELSIFKMEAYIKECMEFIYSIKISNMHLDYDYPVYYKGNGNHSNKQLKSYVEAYQNYIKNIGVRSYELMSAYMGDEEYEDEFEKYPLYISLMGEEHKYRFLRHSIYEAYDYIALHILKTYTFDNKSYYNELFDMSRRGEIWLSYEIYGLVYDHRLN